MSRTQASPTEWFTATFPVKTVAGVKVVYDGESNKMRYYAIEWLVEAFGEDIETATDPQQKLADECERRGYTELQKLFTDETS